MESLKFAEPYFLIIGAIILVLMALAYGKAIQRRMQTLEQFAAQNLLLYICEGLSTQRRLLKFILIMLSVFALFCALARPQKGIYWDEIKQKGIDILFALDTSKSMLSTDVAPDRLSRAKLGLIDFVSNLNGDRIGLIAFAGTAFLSCPLTLDYDAFAQTVNSTDTNAIPKGGTDIASAIEEAMLTLSMSPHQKILIIVSDGEDLESRAISVAKQAAVAGIKIYTIGVGTSSGDVIPAKDKNGRTFFIKDEDGNVVKSKLDERTLRELAEATGGVYVPFGQRGEGIEDIYKESLHLVPKSDFSQRIKKMPLERFEWCIFIAFLLLVIEYAIPDTGKRNVSGMFKAVFLFLILLPTASANASPRDAQKAYERGDYSTAVKDLEEAIQKSPNNSLLPYNLGAALYKSGKFPEAASAFKNALKNKDLSFQERAYYNLGDSSYREGESILESDKARAEAKWKEAITQYDSALKLNPPNSDAKYNRDFVEKKLRDLEKQQQQDQQHQQEQKQENNQNQEANSQNQDSKGNDQSQPTPESASQDKNSKDENGQSKENLASKQEQSQSDQNKENQENASKPEEANKAPKQYSSRRTKGEMTQEEASQMLDSLRGDDAQLPNYNLNQQMRSDEDVRRDW